MWSGPSLLLLLCCTSYGTDAQHQPNSTEAPRRETTPTVRETAAAGAPRVTVSSLSPSSPSFSTTFSTAKVPTSSQRVEEQPSPRRDAPSVSTVGTHEPSTSEPLEDELSNQENIISQLLGDYDKVKTISSGSDCVCRCVVRPIKRSDCTDPTSPSQPAYTVDTITKGTDCKQCVCMAPPSAVNPCEGEYRFKKLQEASKDDIKLATIIDLLEGSLYGLDLLKLQSVTTKLLNRMDDMETAFVANLTERAREKERLKDKVKEKKLQQKKKKVNDMGTAAQKNRPPVNSNKQKNQEGVLMKNQQPEDTDQKQSPNSKTVSQKSVKEKNSVVVKGVTFYKAEEENFRETDRGRAKNTNTSWTLLFSDHLPAVRTLPIQSPAHAPTLSTEPHHKGPSQRESSRVPTERPTNAASTVQQTPATTTNPPTTTKQTTVATPTTTPQTTAQPTTRLTRPSTSGPHTDLRPPADASPTAKAGVATRSRLSWTESPADQPKTTKKPGVCKDTVASLSDPVQYNTYGLSDGAWMKDVRGHGNVIYVTSGLYNNNLQEFRDLQTFKSGQPSNSYKLPYSFAGTGHVVFNGAFYYNRAFSRDIIRYDLRHRYVAAWTTLHDAILEEQIHRTQTEVELAVDESGLWLLYPALDTEGFHQEVILLVHLSPRDLQPIRTFRTGLRRGLYGNSFLVCGVLYGVNSMEHHYANVTYAFDTHTLTHTVPSLAFTNMHGHTSQLAYSPLDKKLYAWDNGHQMLYDVIFAY